MSSLASYIGAIGAVRADLGPPEGRVSGDVGVLRLASLLVGAKAAGLGVVLAGNGGSLSIAQHLATDFRTQAGVRAFALSDAVELTAANNDHPQREMFKRAYEPIRRAGDFLIVMSCSGQSANVIEIAHAVAPARLIVLVGPLESPLGQLPAALKFYAPLCTVGQVQVAHFAILHAACDLLHQGYDP